MRPKRVDITLVKLTKASARRPVCAPYRLNLITLEKFRQLVSILSHDAGEGNRQIVPQREIRFARSLVNATLKYLEDELTPFFAILTRQRFDILNGRRLERLKAVAAVHVLDHTDNVIAFANVLG